MMATSMTTGAAVPFGVAVAGFVRRLEPGEDGYEACDDGNRFTRRVRRLRPALRRGLVHDGVETCDDGNEELDVLRSGLPSARCGDGHVPDVEPVVSVRALRRW